jgi:hypothetical protein
MIEASYKTKPIYGIYYSSNKDRVVGFVSMAVGMAVWR